MTNYKAHISLLKDSNIIFGMIHHSFPQIIEFILSIFSAKHDFFLFVYFYYYYQFFFSF